MSSFVKMREITAHTINDSKLEKPFRLIVGGGSGTGKTTFVKELVDRNHFSSPFDKIVYCYPEYLNDVPIDLDQIVEYRPGICDLTYLSNLPRNTLIIYDDMMDECGKSDDIMKLFTVIARKRNLSIIFLVQNIYNQSKQFRNIRLNATGFVLFKFYAANNVNNRLIRDLGIQSLIGKRQMDKHYDENFSYIMIDIHPQRHSSFVTIKSNIFDKYFTIFHKMEYVAIPKSDFVKYFKVIEAKKGTIKAVKNEIEIRKSSSKRRKRTPPPESSDFSTESDSQ